MFADHTLNSFGLRHLREMVTNQHGQGKGEQGVVKVCECPLLTNTGRNNIWVGRRLVTTHGHLSENYVSGFVLDAEQAPGKRMFIFPAFGGPADVETLEGQVLQ